MGVYIKGMEMPKNCYDCTMESICNRWALHDAEWQKENRDKDCPLVPVPPHGRLIDADVQDAQIEALIERHLHGYTKSTWDFVCELRDILKRNRTIIPAEEGET